jgi:hypothetical protein
MRSWALISATAIATLALCGSAGADWHAGGAGSGYSRAKTMPAGNAPTASVSGRNVTVSWPASSGAVSVDGYIVKRYDTSNNQQSVGASCSGTISGLSCTEQGVPPGDWKYSVTPTHSNWRGAESAKSGAVTVGAATLSLDSSSVSSLPSTVTGQITNFKSAQTVSFRLDDPGTGQVLSGSISPTPVPGNGTASVSVTVPTGTANGSHTVYAVGDQGDAAGAPLTVAVPTTISTSAWDVRDSSSGTESNQSEVDAFANDGRAATSGALLSVFNASRYLQFDLNSPLQTGLNVSGASFNFNFAASVIGQTCFYFEVRRISTGNVIGTHGSAGSPVDCQTGTTLKATSTSLPEVTSSDIADDLRIRVFVDNSLLGGVTRDLATVSGTAAGTPFTLYDTTITDATGLTPSTTPWGLAAGGDGAFYQSANSWQSSFSASRYLKLSFPAYVPGGAPVNAVSFDHSYRSATLGTTCYYLEVYSGASLIGTHGSSGSPVSCNASASSYVTDTVSLPEVNTAAIANGVTVKMYVRNSTGLNRSQHDLAKLQITYVP